MKRKLQLLAWALTGVALIGVIVAALNFRDEEDTAIQNAALPAPFVPMPGQVARGQALALAGDCMACHTVRGGTPYAGGRGIDTPFGTVYAPNLTPDNETGLGTWSATQFWRALHNGRSRDGRLLYPAFPYTNYTAVTRQDADAIYAYLRSLPPVRQAAREHSLRWPFNSQVALALWRAMFFTPGQYVPDPARSPDWNRGAYLVQGLGHCDACHASRNVFGAAQSPRQLGGGMVAAQNWYAPSLRSPLEAGVSDWEIAQIVDLLKKGRSDHASVLGPMAEVVYRSLQYLPDEDARAIAVYLKDLPPVKAVAPIEGGAAPAAVRTRGAKVYEQHCAACHGEQGEGVPGAYPKLAGNRAVTMALPANLVRVVVEGGFPPATAGNPRPYGMPPFAPVLGDDDIAAVISYLRGSWGNAAPAVSAFDVNRLRERAP